MPTQQRTMAGDNGTRPHFHVSNLVHGAMKDLRDERGLETNEIYEIAVYLLLSVDPDSPYRPQPDDDELAAYLDELLEAAEEGGT
jgi:hypothetical protein